MKKILDEFKAFILKGNVIDLAVGIIIGAAFKTVVDSMVGDVIGSVVGFISHKKVFSDIFDGFGKFIGSILNFLMMAAIIFFVFVKPMNALMARLRNKEEAAPPPAPTPEVVLLTEIRDALQGKKPDPPVITAPPTS
jgi:large conductance mechanosensitive channel